MVRRSAIVASAIALGLSAMPASGQSFSDGFTFLKAVKERDGTKATELISQPGSVVINTRDRSTGEAALHLLVRDRDYQWLAYLLAKGAKADVQNRDGNTPLGLAAQIGWVEGAQVLLSHRASADLANSRGETPLMFAVQRRDTAMVELLVDSGANPNKTDSVAGYSALDYARQDRRAANIVKLLQEKKAKPARGVAGPSL